MISSHIPGFEYFKNYHPLDGLKHCKAREHESMLRMNTLMNSEINRLKDSKRTSCFTELGTRPPLAWACSL